MTETKICGVRDPDAFDAAVEAGADWIGLVFFPPSPRAIGADDAGALAQRDHRGTRLVGLFVDPTDAELDAALRQVRLSALQVHAPAARAAAIQTAYGIPVWHAVGIGAAGDLPGSAPGVERLLLDHKALPGASLPGGNARPFDWSLLRAWTAPAPWVLAGGLTPDNVQAAVRATGAPAVDVSSGVERTRGVKDPGLIRAFVAAVRGLSA